MADAATTTPSASDGKMSDEVRKALEAQASGLPPEVVEAEQAQLDEWGTWVAVEPIFYGGVLAVNVGHPVPNANVEQYSYDRLGWVAKRTSKEGKAALASIGIEV